MNLLTFFAQAEMPVPRDLPLPLPLDETSLKLLLVPLFLLHILFVNMTVGGTILTTVYELLGYFRREDKHDLLAKKIASSITVNKSVAVVLGVGPLLIVNLLYTLTFYSSNSLTGHAWILIVPLVTAAFLLTYLHRYTWESWTGRWKVPHMGVGVLSTILFLLIPFIFLGNVNLMQFPDKWYDVQGFFSALTIGNGNVFFRYSHFVIASLAVTSLFLCMWLTYNEQARDSLPAGYTSAEIRRTFYRVAFYVTLCQFVVGPVLLIILPHVGMNATVLVLILGGAVLGAIMLHLLWLEMKSTDQRVGRLWVPIFLIFTATALAMGSGRQAYRDNALTEFNTAVQARTVAFREEVAKFNAEFQASTAEQGGKELFAMVCAACHQVEKDTAAPTLKEIYSLHKDKPEDIVKWALKPEYKRKDKYKTPMPSMAHIGEDKLAKIADYMLRVGSGEEEFVIDDSQWIRNLEAAEVMKVAVETPGDAKLGGGLFITQTCVSCHVAEEGQRSVGPSLANVSKRLNREQIIKSILDPSDTIAKGYETFSVVTWEGLVHTGLIVERNETAGTLKLRLADGKVLELLEDDLDGMKQQEQSQMPNGVVDNITPTQLAHLAAYVESLE